jgi:hypothetical protein
MDFPQYRKLEGFRRYYRINDERSFDEIVVVNGKVTMNRIEANQFPEMLRIQDMLNCEWNYRVMDAKTFEDQTFEDI